MVFPLRESSPTSFPRTSTWQESERVTVTKVANVRTVAEPSPYMANKVQSVCSRCDNRGCPKCPQSWLCYERVPYQRFSDAWDAAYGQSLVPSIGELMQAFANNV